MAKADAPTASALHGPCLAVALLLMLAGTVYPPALADAQGRADHALAMAWFWAMSAGFVRGVGFVPRHWLWRWVFSGWSCLLGLVVAGGLKALHGIA